MASELLRRAGFDTVTVDDGFKALQAVHDYAPDLIVLDVMMPLINGYQVCRLLKYDKATQDIPVIMLTSKSQHTDRYWGLATGADAYITKGHEIEELVPRVTEILKGASPRREREAPDAEEKETTPFDILARVNELLDRRLFEVTIMNEITKVAFLVQGYRDTVRATLRTIAQVLDFHAAALLLEAEDERALHIIPLRPLNDTRLLWLERFTVQEAQLAERGGVQLKRYIDRSSSDEGAPSFPMESDAAESGFVDVTVVPIRRGAREGGGLLVLAGDRKLLIGPEDEEALHRLVSQAIVVIDNARLYERVHKMAIQDGLTGAYNHTHFHDLLKQELMRSQRYRRPFGVVMMDIDHFKKVNDAFGHQVGDEALRALANRCREELRETDVLGRYGGEEFVVLLPETGLKRAIMVAERLRRSVAEMSLSTEKGPLKMTISIGVTAWPDCGADDPSGIIARADAALYNAKHRGRNRVATLV
jgi:two-component system cell cycle response regulator